MHQFSQPLIYFLSLLIFKHTIMKCRPMRTYLQPNIISFKCIFLNLGEFNLSFIFLTMGWKYVPNTPFFSWRFYLVSVLLPINSAPVQSSNLYRSLSVIFKMHCFHLSILWKSLESLLFMQANFVHRLHFIISSYTMGFIICSYILIHLREI